MIEDFNFIRDVARVYEQVGEWFHHVYPDRKIYTAVDIDEQREHVLFSMEIEYKPGELLENTSYLTFDQANGKDLYFNRMVKDRLFDELTKSIRKSMVPTFNIVTLMGDQKEQQQ